MSDNKPIKPNIFEYDFNWNPKGKSDSNENKKEDCCERYKKKGEKKCKSCPKRK